MKTFMKIIVSQIIIVWSFGACQKPQTEPLTPPEITPITPPEINLEAIEVHSIETFARLYGYARWFHPSDEASEIDWDKLAVLGVRKVGNIKSTEELQDVLFSLFSPVVQGLQIFQTDEPQEFNLNILSSPDRNKRLVAWQHFGIYLNENSNIYKSERTKISKLFDRMPQFGEVTKEPIGNNLTCVVPLTLQTNNSFTYPKTETLTLVRLKSEIAGINYVNEPNMTVNLASVMIAWNVLQHFFPYFDVIDVDWNSVLGETLKSTLTNERQKDFWVTLSRMIAQLDDGHGVVYGEQMYHLPIRTEFIENEIVITASNNAALVRGDIVKTMNGKPAMKVLEEMEEIISGSPQLRRHRALNILGSTLDLGKETLLEIDRDGGRQHVTVSNSFTGKSMFFNPIDFRKYLSETIVEIEPGIYYVNMTRSTENDFVQRINVLANAKAVIYDCRGGSQLNFFVIAPYLTAGSVTSTWWHIPQTIYPDQKEVVFEKSNWSIQPKQPFFKSKSIIINVPSVVSSGETMMGIIDHYNLAITVGEPTAGCNGNVNYINLPCGYRIMWTGMKVPKHDGNRLYIDGFQPDYPVNKTIQAIKEGRDEYLEKALEIARRE